jgi:hypothetical protein
VPPDPGYALEARVESGGRVPLDDAAGSGLLAHSCDAAYQVVELGLVVVGR